MENLLEKLNSEQIKPVLDTEGAVLVIAGAGSGKTRVLTSRIAHLVQKGVSPYKILAITFTNKAADEMKNRLSQMVDGAENMWVSTIHSMCVRILRRSGSRIGYESNFSIYSETDRDRVIKRVCDALGYDDEKLIKGAKFRISDAKTYGLTPSQYAQKNKEDRNIHEYTKIYEHYEDELQRSNALDFDDLLVKTRDLLACHPDILQEYAGRFEYVHVDEFQDVNSIQYQLVCLLSSVHKNVFVVGDDDQSIYGWRGAEIKNILDFDKDFPSAKVYKLEQNYRSTKKILDLANTVICKNAMRRQKKLWTENDEGDQVGYFDAYDENDEALRTAREIRRLVDYGHCKYKDVAVLMRLNALSRAYEQEFTKYGIPYKVYGGFRFFERKEIKDLIAYLRLLNNPLDDESLLRIINVPKRAIGQKTVENLYTYARSQDLSVFDAVVDVENIVEIPSAARNKISAFKKLIVSLIAEKETKTISELMKTLIEATDFLSQFADNTEENLNKRLNIGEFQNSVEEFEKLNPGANLSDYLSSVTLSSDTDDMAEGNAVSLATVHAVKGLEFDTVFVCGLDESIFPISRAENSIEESEEERRLMYVAVTRAEKRLYLTRANSRYLYGERQYMKESRFVKELAKQLGIREKNPYGFRRDRDDCYLYDVPRSSDYGNAWRPSAPSYQRESRMGFGANTTKSTGGFASSFLKGQEKPTATAGAKDTSAYKPGAKVRHAKFGEGTVIVVKGSGSNVIADVAFKGVGVKSLSVQLAPMEIIP